MTQKVMIWGQWGTGDHISIVLPLARNLSRQGYITHGVFHNLNGYRLLHNAFDVSFMLPNFYADDYSNKTAMTEVFRDVANFFPRYDAVYATSAAVRNFLLEIVDESLLSNFVRPLYPENTPSTESVTLFKLRQFGQEGSDEDIFLNVDPKFYQNFECGEKSVLLHSVAKGLFKTYAHHDMVKSLLELQGFDVREISNTTDIRINLHLIDQVKYVLTTDTVILWMAKALGKSPCVFLSEGRGEFGRTMENKLGVRNIVEWRYDINEIQPQEIVDGFMEVIS